MAEAQEIAEYTAVMCVAIKKAFHCDKYVSDIQTTIGESAFVEWANTE